MTKQIVGTAITQRTTLASDQPRFLPRLSLCDLELIAFLELLQVLLLQFGSVSLGPCGPHPPMLEEIGTLVHPASPVAIPRETGSRRLSLGDNIGLANTTKSIETAISAAEKIVENNFEWHAQWGYGCLTKNNGKLY